VKHNDKGRAAVKAPGRTMAGQKKEEWLNFF
jgi:hypothetical protein